MKSFIFCFFIISAYNLKVIAQLTMSQNGTSLVYAASGCAADKYRKTNSANQSTGTLTSNSGQNGAFWSCNTIDLNTSFKLTFNASFGSDATAGDGIAFVMETEVIPPGIIGGRGGGIGYAAGDGSNCQSGTCPISPSVVVEFDTYNNYSAGVISDLPTSGATPGTDHIAVQKNGLQGGSNVLAGPIAAKSDATTIKNGVSYPICITWDVATTRLTVYFNGVSRLSYVGDIRTPFGAAANAVWWGFTSATGGSAQTHTISSVVMNTGLTSPTCAIVLPVDLAFFNLVTKDKANELSWETYSERENAYFTLERSTDGENFELLATIDGSGNSTTTNKYTYTDYKPLSETNYYRLSQTDFNGEKKLIGFRVSTHENDETTDIVSNPFDNICKIRLNSKTNNSKQISICDASGKFIYNQTYSLSKGVNNLELDLSNNDNGMYTVIISDENNINYYKVIKLKN